MSDRQYRVKMYKRIEVRESLPSPITVQVFASTSINAKTIAEQQQHSYKAMHAEEVRQPKPAKASSSSSSSNSEPLGCKGIIEGVIAILVLMIILVLVSKCSGGSNSNGPSAADVPAPQSRPWTEEPMPPPSRGSIVGMDTTPRQQPSAEQAQSIADAASQSAAVEVASGLVGSRARIVDSRDRIVLQSGPKMSSKNVAKIDTGSTVQVVSDEGKWVQVRTDDGLVGYVRRTQLEPLQ